ncbi:DUF5994 family protein [Actinocrispum sp. NPDC049592]|uniref:DUF5994 family protein n=1 Tax=Actinocrispum sp. NPDC049592 TaxID=3154835 RepID=UPI003443A01A
MDSPSKTVTGLLRTRPGEANTVVLTGSDQKQIRLLVVPPATPGGVARAVLRSVSRPDTVATVEEILASNGVSLDEQPKAAPVTTLSSHAIS